MKHLYAKSHEGLLRKLKLRLQKLGVYLPGEMFRDGSLHYVEVDEDSLVREKSDMWYWISTGEDRAMFGYFHDEPKWIAHSNDFFNMKELAIFIMQYAGARAYSEQRRAACEYWMMWNEKATGEDTAI